MQIDPLLAHITEQLIEQLGETAQQARAEAFSAPISEWQNRDVLDFVDALRQITGDDYMGLATAPCAVGTATFLIELSTRCSTLREAVDMGCRLMAIATTAFEFSLTETGQQAEISIHQISGKAGTNNILSTWTAIAWHKLLQWLIDREVSLDKVEFQHELDSAFAHYASMFCGHCVFGRASNRLRFARSYLDRRIVRLPREGDHLRATTPGYFAAPGLVARSWNQLVRNTHVGNSLWARHPSPSSSWHRNSA